MGKLFFCHIPKTGGTAFRKALESAFRPWEIMPDAYMIARNGGHYPEIDVIERAVAGSKPDKIQLLRGHYLLSDGRILGDDVRSIVIVREPVARTISHLRHTIIHFGFSRDLLREHLDNGRIPLPDNVQSRFLSRGLKAGTLDIDAFKNEVAEAVKKIHYISTTNNIDNLCRRLSSKELNGKKLILTEENKTPEVDFEFTQSDIDLFNSKNTVDIWLYQHISSMDRELS